MGGSSGLPPNALSLSIFARSGEVSDRGGAASSPSRFETPPDTPHSPPPPSFFEYGESSVASQTVAIATDLAAVGDADSVSLCGDRRDAARALQEGGLSAAGATPFAVNDGRREGRRDARRRRAVRGRAVVVRARFLPGRVWDRPRQEHQDSKRRGVLSGVIEGVHRSQLKG